MQKLKLSVLNQYNPFRLLQEMNIKHEYAIDEWASLLQAMSGCLWMKIV